MRASPLPWRAGKILTGHLEERPRIETVDYQGSRHLDRGKLEEPVKIERIELRSLACQSPTDPSDAVSDDDARW